MNRLKEWSNNNKKITPNQFGFQKGKSISDCIFILQSIITKTLNEKEKLYCVFIDYQQFFDRIDHEFLWHKLMKEKVSNHFIESLKAMYNAVKLCVKFNAELSPFFSYNTGVKQGDPSSPLLAMFFLNDLIDNITSERPEIITLENIRLFLILYADDMILFAKSPECLQLMLNEVENYCNLWGLKINVSKTKAMVFENGRSRSIDLSIYNTKIEFVNSFKYLDVVLFNNGNFLRTQKILAQHASFSLHKLFQIFEQFEFPVSQKVKLFDILVGPILHYCAEIWGSHPGTDVEFIHTKFIRYILGVKKSTSTAALYGELERVPLSVHRKYIMIKYWKKIITLPESSPVKKIYYLLKTDDLNNKTYKNKNWATQIKSIFNEIGLSSIWISEEIDDNCLTLVRQRIYDQYFQKWYSDINNSSKLTTYSKFKHTITREKYLDVVKENYLKRSLAQLRTSSHQLAIETGRYSNTPQNKRLCNFCNMNAVESEYHFLLVCPKYKDLRKKFFKAYFCRWPTVNKFIALINSESKIVLNNLAKFIFFANKVRTQQSD